MNNYKDYSDESLIILYDTYFDFAIKQLRKDSHTYKEAIKVKAEMSKRGKKYKEDEKKFKQGFAYKKK